MHIYIYIYIYENIYTHIYIYIHTYIFLDILDAHGVLHPRKRSMCCLGHARACCTLHGIECAGAARMCSHCACSRLDSVLLAVFAKVFAKVFVSIGCLINPTVYDESIHICIYT